MVKVEWSERASDELDQIIDYIEADNPAAAERTAARLLTLSASLVDFPNRGRPGPCGTRELVTVPPYIMQYDVDGDRVTILAVRHGRRQPRG